MIFRSSFYRNSTLFLTAEDIYFTYPEDIDFDYLPNDKYHYVNYGDTVDYLAYKYYYDERKMLPIIRANVKRFPSAFIGTVSLSSIAGKTIVIPDPIYVITEMYG
jgi:hypothetical protein